MADENALALLRRRTPGEPVGWEEVVTGYDFGLLCPEEIQEWTRTALPPHRWDRDGDPPNPEAFESLLWSACREATGRAPRPGDTRWARAQDRWRRALLTEALEVTADSDALRRAVEDIYERVGCPEDMLHLWKRHAPWIGRSPTADRSSVEAFLQQRLMSLAG